MAQRTAAPMIATNAVLYHHPGRRTLQDVLTCIREGTTIDRAGRRLQANAERHLKPPAQMARLFRGHEAALAAFLRAQGIAPGDRVLLVSENRPEFPIADTAIMAIGAMTVPRGCKGKNRRRRMRTGARSIAAPNTDRASASSPPRRIARDTWPRVASRKRRSVSAAGRTFRATCSARSSASPSPADRSPRHGH
jgi:non-ribosomal peptide synthetase component E (peptide arylation enzyme)